MDIMAEVEARGWTFEWEDDDSPDLSWMTEEELKEEHEVVGLMLRDRKGDVLDSLWGITDPDYTYCRELEREMAEGAIEEITRAVLEAL